MTESSASTTPPHPTPLSLEERIGDASDDGSSGRKTLKFLRSLAEWSVLIILAIVVAVVVRTFVLQVFYIPSGSMLPTLQINDRVLVNKLSYAIGDPDRGDIVVFVAPKEAQTGDIKDLIKRVVGLPGETVEGRGGKIYINGNRIPEDYLPSGTISKDFARVSVPANKFFMLGDNRLLSRDSTVFGPVVRESLIGRMFVIIWPFDHILVSGSVLGLGLALVVVGFISWWILGKRRQRQDPDDDY